MAAAGMVFETTPVPFPKSPRGLQEYLRSFSEREMTSFITEHPTPDLMRIHFERTDELGGDQDGNLAHFLIEKSFDDATQALYETLAGRPRDNMFFGYCNDDDHVPILTAALQERVGVLRYFHEQGVPLNRKYVDVRDIMEHLSVSIVAAEQAGSVPVVQLLFELGYDREVLHSQLAFVCFRNARDIAADLDFYDDVLRFLAAVGSDVFSGVSYAELDVLAKRELLGVVAAGRRLPRIIEAHTELLGNMALAEKQPEDVRPFYTALLVGNAYLDDLKESLRRGNFGASPRRFFEKIARSFLADSGVRNALNRPAMKPMVEFFRSYGHLGWLLPQDGSVEMKLYAHSDLLEVGRLFFGRDRSDAKWTRWLANCGIPPEMWLTILSLIFRPTASDLGVWRKMVKASFPRALGGSAGPGLRTPFVHIVL
jgi:hypothetical protein